MSQHFGSELKKTFKCPRCGCDRFVVVQTGYERHTPCQITPNGKKAVCFYDGEVLDETDDGQLYHRYFDCAKCDYTLTTDDLDELPGCVELIDTADVEAEVKEEDYKDVPRE